MEFSLDDLYQSPVFFLTHRDQLLMAMHNKITKLYDGDTTLVYYYVTNYYFEIDRKDSLRIKGVRKEHRPINNITTLRSAESCHLKQPQLKDPDYTPVLETSCITSET